MPLQLPDFQRIGFQEANPWIGGAMAAQNLMQAPMDLRAKMIANALNQYKQQQEAARAQYYPQMAKAELAKAQAEPQEIMARTGLYGEQAKWFAPTAQSEIGLRSAQQHEAEALAGVHGIEAQTNALKLKMLRDYLAPQGQPSAQGTEAGGVGGQTGVPATSQAPMTSNMNYGIEDPQPSRQDFINQTLFGIDSFSPKKQMAKEQIMNQYNEYQKEIAGAVQEANAATNMKQAISVFNNAMDASLYKGSRFGHLPSSGVGSVLVPGNLSAEQEADRAALQMLPGAITTLKDSMGSARFSNLDMNMASKMKFDRTMDDETRTLQTAWVNAVSDRAQEQAKFYSMMGNPKSGALKTQADMLWGEYQQNYPLVNEKGNTVLRENIGNWPLYTTPKALASIKRTGTYKPTEAEKNSYMMQVPDNRGIYHLVPIKKGKVESAIRKGARLP